MATQETQLLDDIIVKSRRKMLTLGATSLAAMMLGATRKAEAATTYTDADILNFALNLEYLEANFYYLAAFGCTINSPNSAATTAGAPSAGIPITGSVGTAGTVSGGSKVPFSTTLVAAYATETAIEEGKHVLFLQSALGSSAVAQPAINLGTVWQALAGLANAATTPAGNIPTSFSPYAASTGDVNFLVGAYVFEDVGVTAYHGAASLLTVSGNLSAAGGILAVEAYHAGLIRTSINAADPTGTAGPVGYTNSISALRAAASASAAPSPASPYDHSPDDYGLATAQVSLGGASNTTATHIVDVDLTASDATNSIAFARTTTQVLAIVTAGGKVSSPAAGAATYIGGFFPAGLNAGPNGFH